MTCVNRKTQNEGTVVHDMLRLMKPKHFNRGVRIPESALSLHHSSVLFFNATGRSVAIFWVNYDGMLVKYVTLPESKCFLSSTFIGHLWLAIDSVTGAQYQIDGKYVFSPETPATNQRVVKVFITVPVMTLYEYSLGTAVRSIKPLEALNNPNLLSDLPRRITEDVLEAIKKKIFIDKHEFDVFPLYHWVDLKILTV